MNLFKNIRNFVFWLLDTLKGSKIKNELKDINDSFNLKSYKDLQNKNAIVLEKLLSITVESSRFYAKYKNYTSLNDFPVINKLIIKKNFESINIESENSSDFISLSTSGSTGIPFEIFQTKEKKVRNMADTLFFAESAGFSLGDKLLYLRLWSAYYKKPSLIAKLQNIEQLNVEDFKEDYMKELFIRLQSDKSPKGWLGYPSAFEKMCNYLEKNNSKPLNCNVKSIIAMAEPLFDDIKKKMEFYFQNPVVSRYSNVENGIIAQQIPGKDYFKINWASYIVELLDFDKNIPVKNGELGRIVLTDLYNHATPMIRYDTGDVGSFIVDKTCDGNDFPMFKSVQGRITDILRNPDGEVVSPFIIHAILHTYPELTQVQLVQKTVYEYTFKINCEGKFDREKEFLDFFKTYLGKKAVLDAEYVDEIPLLKSGKRKLIVNLVETPATNE